MLTLPFVLKNAHIDLGKKEIIEKLKEEIAKDLGITLVKKQK